MFYCTNTEKGLVPNYDSDLEKMKKLKIGDTVKCQRISERNYGFHKKFFALIKLGCDNSQLEVPMDVYRKIMTVRAKFYKAYKTDKGIYREPESINFDTMSQERFEELYSRVLDEIVKDLGTTSEELEREIVGFM
jgi:hypothetical protein